MLNLIITIIGLLLVGVAAVSAVYYGGAAYNDYIVDSKAGEIVSRLNQMKAAALGYYASTGRNFPYEGTDCAGGSVDPGSTKTCWMDVVTGNVGGMKYLNVTLGSTTGGDLAAQPMPPINFLNYGIGINPVESADGTGNFPDGAGFIYATDTTKTKLYVEWYVNTTNYTGSASAAKLAVFFRNVCAKINKIMGINPALYTINNSNISGTSVPYALPFSTSPNPGYEWVSASYPMNACAASDASSATNPSFYIYIPVF